MSGIRRSKMVVVIVLALMLAVGSVPGATAQESGALVRVARVDSQAFPRVTAYVTVLDRNGLPLVGLTEANLSLLEDGNPVPTSSIKVESDTSQPLRLVLALDLSTPASSLDLARQAIGHFIDTQLEPQDQVALIAFDYEVRRVQPFTNDKGALKASLDTLEANHTYTSLHETVLKATAMLSALEAGRKAMLVVVDIEDNTDTRSAEEAIGAAQESEIPVHVIAFGPKIKETDFFYDVANGTRGQSFVLARPEQVQARLQTMGIVLRQGYKVTFQSGLQADGAEHDLVFGVKYPGGEGAATTRFVATRGEVSVIPLMDWQQIQPGAAERTVAGMVHFAAQATTTAPTALASVEYVLDGQSLGDPLTEPPYSLDWDSTTVDPGRYSLVVRALDGAGNQGEAQASLEVIVPVVVTLSPFPNVIALGDEITIGATVDAPGRGVSVTFLLDGQPVGQMLGPHYSFDWSSADVEPGRHTLAVRAVDEEGYQAEDEVPLNVVVPLQVSIDASEDQLVLGEPVTVTAQVEALAGVAVVEFRVDGILVDGDFASTHQVPLKSGDYRAGDHVVTVRVVDVAGREESDSLNLRFLLPPKPERDWTMFIAIVALIAAGLLALLLLMLLIWWLKRRLQKRYTLEIGNTGNIGSSYELRAKDAFNVLKFQFVLDGVNLTQQRAAAQEAETARQAERAGEQRREERRRARQAKPKRGRAQAKGAAPAPLGAAADGDKISGAASAFRDAGNVLSGVGTLVGGSAGQSIRQVSTQVSAPGQKLTQAQYVREKAAGMAPAAGQAKQQGMPPEAVAFQTEQPVLPSEQPVRPVEGVARGGTRAGPPTPAVRPASRGWIHTPVVEPGEALSMDLLVDPIKLYPRRRRSFAVLSRSAEQMANSLLREEASTVVYEGHIEIGSASWVRHYLPALLFVCLSAIVILSLAFWMANVGMLG